VFQLGRGSFPGLRSLDEARARVRRRRAIAALGLVAAAAAVGVAFVMTHDEAFLRAVDAHSVGVIDPHSGHIVGQVSLGASPRKLAFGAGAVWSANGDDESVSEIDPARRSLAKTFKVDGFAEDVAVGDGEAWVVTTNGSYLEVLLTPVDPQYGVQNEPIVPGGSSRAGLDVFSERADRIAIRDGSIWLTNTGTASASGSGASTGGALRRVSLRTRATEESIPLGRVKELLVTGSSIWVTEIGAVTHIDLAAGTRDRISLGGTAVPNGIVAGEQAVWIASGPFVRPTSTGSRMVGSGTLTRIDPRTNAVVATIPLGGNPRGVAATKGAVWVTDRARSQLLRIDTATNRVSGAIALGNTPEDVVGGDGLLWVSVP
jgi:YVTN family beta-propeller protein